MVLGECSNCEFLRIVLGWDSAVLGTITPRMYIFFFFFFFRTLLLSSFWTSRGHRCCPFSPPVLAFNSFIAHRVQQSHCSSIFHRVLLTHALALSASQFVHKKKSQGIYTSMHSAGLELTKLTYTRLEDNLIRHRGDRLYIPNIGYFGVNSELPLACQTAFLWTEHDSEHEW